VSFDSVNTITINVYMPFGDNDNHIDEFVNELTIVEEIVSGHSVCHGILAGDFNVDFCRDWCHTMLYSIVSGRMAALFSLIVILPPTSTTPINLT
jgi:hypothetical protein